MLDVLNKDYITTARSKGLSENKVNFRHGFRNAIIPVFCQQVDGRMYGVGTAFHVDGFGNFLTAYHVIDFVEKHLSGRPILFLSMHAVVFGTINIPPDCFVPADEVIASMGLDTAELRAAVERIVVRELTRPVIDAEAV